MSNDAHQPVTTLNVDGGMTQSDILLQIQADLLGVDVRRAAFHESTAFGAAFAAGLHLGVYAMDYKVPDEEKSRVFRPAISEELREESFKQWNKAVDRSLGWVEETKE